MRRRHVPKLPAKMSKALSSEVSTFLHRIGGRFVRRPAHEVAFWLACIPLIIPAPLLASAIALSKLHKEDNKTGWVLILVASTINLLISAFLLTWLYFTLGDWILDRLRELLGPFLIWPTAPEVKSIPV